MLWSRHEEYVSGIIANNEHLGNQLEVETKMGYWRSNKQGNESFQSNVRYVHYKQLIESLKLEPGVTIETNTIITTNYGAGYRKRQVNNSAPQWERKLRLPNVSDIDDKNFFFRISFSSEVNVEPLPPSKQTGIVLTRSMTRISHYIPAYGIIVDASTVTTSGRSDHFSTEVEVEMVKPCTADKVPAYFKGITYVLKMLYGTENLYQEGLRKALNYAVQTNAIAADTDIKNVNITDNYIDRRILTEARSLKIADLKMGGMVGGKWKMTCTHKTDGRRMMLIVCKLGVWLVFPPYEYNLLVPSGSNPILASQGLTVFDGELIPMSRRRFENDAPTDKYWFQVIDILFANGSSVQHQHMDTDEGRFASAEKELYRLKDINVFPENLHVSTKNCNSWSEVEGFFNITSDMLAEVPSLKFKTDGLMFIPVNHKYLIYNWNVRSKDRDLTKLPDICKWKPPDQVTIDFEIKRDRLGIKLYSESSDRNEFTNKPNVLFVGIEDRPFKYDSMLIKSHPYTNSLPDGIIVEYAWKYIEAEIVQKITVNDEEVDFVLPMGNYLYPVRTRTEKAGPNREDVAIANWMSILYPIFADDLSGRSHGLMYRYHGDIKRSLYEAAVPPQRSNTRRYLLEIAAGVGGDVNKWRTYDYVIAVEPDEDIDLTKETNRRKKLDILDERIADSPMKGKVKVLNNRGQDTDAIVSAVRLATGGRGVDTVSIMLALTFFWDNIESLKALAATINKTLAPGGKLIWMTLDGDRVREIFTPSLGGLNYKIINFGPTASIEPEFDSSGDMTGKIVTTLPGIVGKQTEYLVTTTDLEQLLEGFEPGTKRFADQNDFLPDSSKALSKLYSYGIWTKRGTPEKISPVEMQQAPTLGRGLTGGLNMAAPLFAGPSLGGATPTSFAGPSLGGATPTSFAGPSLGGATPCGPIPCMPAACPLNPVVPLGSGDITPLPAIGGYQNIVKIRAKGDGNCLIHSLLLCISETYRKAESSVKCSMARSMRRDLADWLLLPDATGALNWETANRGGLMYVFSNQLTALAQDSNIADRKEYMDELSKYKVVYGKGDTEAQRDVFNRMVALFRRTRNVEPRTSDEVMAPPPIQDGTEDAGLQDYSLPGLFSLYNSDAYLGDEIINVLAQIFSIDIYIISDNGQSAPTRYNGYFQNQRRQPAICIIYNGGHYDAVGVADPATGVVQTVFPSGSSEDTQHPFISVLRYLNGYDLYNLLPPNPKDAGPFSLQQAYVDAVRDLVSQHNNRIPDIVYRCLEGNKKDSEGVRYPSPFLDRLWEYEVQLKALGITNTATDYYIGEAVVALRNAPADLRDEIIRKNCYYIARMSSDKEFRDLVDLTAKVSAAARSIVTSSFPNMEQYLSNLPALVPWLITSIGIGNKPTREMTSALNLFTAWNAHTPDQITGAAQIINDRYTEVGQRLLSLV
jgi:hypothetical protein